MTYFKFPHKIRKMIYTTNVIEGYHRQLRKVTKTKTAYPSDEAVAKIICLATMDIQGIQKMDGNYKKLG